MEIKTYGKCKAVMLETFEDAQKYGKSTGWPCFTKPESFANLKAKGDLYLIQDTESKAKYLYQPTTKNVEAFDKNNRVDTENELFVKYPELKNIGETSAQVPAQETTPPKEEQTPPVQEALSSLYLNMSENRKKHKRNIDSSTTHIAQKAHPKSPIMFDLEAELLGLDPEKIKKLPMNAIEILADAIRNLLSATEKDPQLRGALRKYVNKLFSSENNEDETSVMENFKSILTALSEAKATRFNYTKIKDIEDGKVTDMFFLQLLDTFDLRTNTTRIQKQGILMFLKKLATIADENPTIAIALTKIVRIENSADQNLQTNI